ncbi:MAG TPA: hypothetical protein VHL98_19225 [Microvirga sp.]|jgi:hypothetical protein|nr:hypothetical protein [Microvirga sp.]
MSDAENRPTGDIIALPDPSTRPRRAPLAEGEPRGEILLFTGVRYDRLGPNSGPSHFSDGTRRRRRS